MTTSPVNPVYPTNEDFHAANPAETIPGLIQIEKDKEYTDKIEIMRFDISAILDDTVKATALYLFAQFAEGITRITGANLQSDMRITRLKTESEYLDTVIANWKTVEYRSRREAAGLQ
jgi:hypothetical protein